MKQNTSAIALITSKDLGRLFNVTVVTLWRWRKDGTGPPFLRLGGNPKGRVVYRVQDVEAWLKQRVQGVVGKAVESDKL